MTRMIAFDWFPKEGRLKLVPESEYPDWTVPPEGLNRAQRRCWRKLFSYYRNENAMDADYAWYLAAKRTVKEFGQGRK